MYCIVLSIMLFSNAEWRLCLIFKNLQACGYHVPPSVETGCSPYFLIRDCIKRSATNIFLSFDMLIWRISRLSFSMAIHNQIYSEPTLMIVSSIINSVTRIFLELNISGLYLWIQSLMAVWLLLTNLDTALDVSLWKTKEIKIDTENMLCPQVLFSFLFDIS